VVRHHVDTDGETWSSDEGTLFISRTIGNVVFQQFSGRLTMEFVELMLKSIQPRLDEGRQLIGFNDWWGMTGYSTEARVALTQWLFNTRGRVAEMHVLVRGKLVAMGVSVANLMLGGFLIPYTRPESFKEALGAKLGLGTILLRRIA
jgi:hypothetical protein